MFSRLLAVAALAATAVVALRGDSMETKAKRNNNPANLRFYALGWRGEVGHDEDGFSIFDKMENGVRAAYINMRTKYYRDGVDTIAKLIPVWAPAHENNVEAYINYVAGRVGLLPHEVFEFNSADAFNILQAIIRFEMGEELAAETIEAGVILA